MVLILILIAYSSGSRFWSLSNKHLLIIWSHFSFTICLGDLLVKKWHMAGIPEQSFILNHHLLKNFHILLTIILLLNRTSSRRISSGADYDWWWINVSTRHRRLNNSILRLQDWNQYVPIGLHRCNDLLSFTQWFNCCLFYLIYNLW